MKKILPPARPKRDDATLDAVIEHFNLVPTRACLIYVRGHYLDTMGRPGVDDVNIYDDAVYLVSPNRRESWNANTSPSFPKKGYAELVLGQYVYYPSYHHIWEPKKRYRAFRPYPEGIKLKCLRNGKLSTCQATNLHMGSDNPAAFDVVWSQGCMTVPRSQYPDYELTVRTEVERCNGDYIGNKTATGKPSKLIDVVLIENRSTPTGQHLYDAAGRMI